MRAYNPAQGLNPSSWPPYPKPQPSNPRASPNPENATVSTQKQHTTPSLKPPSPEIQRTDLAPVILSLKTLGIDNVLRFEYISPSRAESMIRALELLYSLEALDEHGRLTTPMGQRMAAVPLAPAMARMLLGSSKSGCTDEVLSIAAMCSVQGIGVRAEGDKRMEHGTAEIHR